MSKEALSNFFDVFAGSVCGEGRGAGPPLAVGGVARGTLEDSVPEHWTVCMGKGRPPRPAPWLRLHPQFVRVRGGFDVVRRTAAQELATRRGLVVHRSSGAVEKKPPVDVVGGLDDDVKVVIENFRYTVGVNYANLVLE